LSAAWAISAATAGPSQAAVMLNVGVHVGDPPPPPAFVFDSEPEVILVPSTRVYYVPEQDFDLYRYGRYWYINRGGWWYRSAGYRGPFGYIGYDRVPVSVMRVPPKYHRHPMGGPPGQIRPDGYGQASARAWHGEPARGEPARGEASKPKHWDRH
jgi:hypothetical protein